MKRLITLTVTLVLTLPAWMQAREFTVLQWNIWQEGTMVPGGYEAVVDEIARLRPDFVTLSEVRNYHGVDFTARLVESLGKRGEEYHSSFSRDTGLLSRYPILEYDTVFPECGDHGSIYRLLADMDGHQVAVYTAHLDYLDDAYYNVRGYDGSTWKETPIPASLEELLERNTRSQRDDAICAFIERAQADREAGRMVIIGGDFNEPSHQDWTEATKDMYDHNGFVVPWTVTTLLAEAGFIDAYRTFFPDVLTHPGFTFPSDNQDVRPEKLTWAPKSDERDRIDYIWYSPAFGVELRDAAIFGPESSIVRSERVYETSADPFITPLGVWPTDHKGVLVTFSY